MDNYVIWKPERDGHAPPFLEAGMYIQLRNFAGNWVDVHRSRWTASIEYRVPAEAVNGPAIDDARDNALFDVEAWLAVDGPFDVQAWLAVGRANADKLPAGVVLPEPTDWADELVKEWRDTPLCEAVGLADFLRTHCQPREVSNG